ncbi:thiamine monophosphate synthase [Desulfurispirillum indicum S5]|uniref:Thiamine-phosphate synthase n=2 Tax=Desulfurispirillum TaxID=393029 RepID=E6W3R9_DESIS|nr:thiamine monophosphate synthase [Desulfurispirillum indicum S5]
MERKGLMFTFCAITAADALGDHCQTAASALEGGADMIQLRAKELSGDDLLVCAKKIMELKSRFRFTFIVNDSIEAALKSNADGVHLGQDDDGLEFARDILGPDAIVGISTHTLQQAKSAVAAGADYIGFGPMFATMTKSSEYEPREVGDLLKVAQGVEVPVCAIGGISVASVAQLIVAPNVFVASISGFRREDMKAAVGEYVHAVEECRRLKGFDVS